MEKCANSPDERDESLGAVGRWSKQHDSVVLGWGKPADVREIKVQGHQDTLLFAAPIEYVLVRPTGQAFGDGRFDIVPGFGQGNRGVPWNVLIGFDPNWHGRLALGRKRNDPFPGQFGGIGDGGPNGRLRQSRILRDQLRGSETSRQVVEDDRHWNPGTGDAWYATHDLGCRLDVLLPIHAVPSETDAEF